MESASDEEYSQPTSSNIANIPLRDSARERYRLHNELVCLVRALQGKCTTIDLRNDTYVTGVLTHVDGNMNVQLENAVLVNRRGDQCLCDNFFILGRNIRYVHIPEGESIMDLIRSQLSSMGRKPKPKVSTKKTFKLKRALMNHLNTVASLGESGENDNS